MGEAVLIEAGWFLKYQMVSTNCSRKGNRLKFLSFDQGGVYVNGSNFVYIDQRGDSRIVDRSKPLVKVLGRVFFSF